MDHAALYNPTFAMKFLHLPHKHNNILLRIPVRPACDRPRNSNRGRVAHRSDNSVVTLLEQLQELVTGGGLTSPQSCQLATRAGLFAKFDLPKYLRE